jgi:hypothetical protein
MGAMFALPGLTSMLPSLIGAGTQLGTAGIIADKLPETIGAIGDAVGEIIGSTGETVTKLLSDNPLLVAGVVGITGFIVYRKMS